MKNILSHTSCWHVRLLPFCPVLSPFLIALMSHCDDDVTLFMPLLDVAVG
jgi:hypothetical protein